jgi:hypothetical protein
MNTKQPQQQEWEGKERKKKLKILEEESVCVCVCVLERRSIYSIVIDDVRGGYLENEPPIH